MRTVLSIILLFITVQNIFCSDMSNYLWKKATWNITTAYCISDDGSLFSASDQYRIQIYDRQSGKTIDVIKKEDDTEFDQSVVYFLNDREMIIDEALYRVYYYNLDTKKKEFLFNRNKWSFSNSTFTYSEVSGNKQFFAYFTEDTLYVYNIKLRTIHKAIPVDFHKYSKAGDMLSWISFSPDSKVLAAISTKAMILFYDVESGNLLDTMNVNDYPDGIPEGNTRTLINYFDDSTLVYNGIGEPKLWNIHSRAITKTLYEGLAGGDVSNDKRYIFFDSWGSLVIYDVINDKYFLYENINFLSTKYSLAHIPFSNQIITRHHNLVARYDFFADKYLEYYNAYGRMIFSPDSKYLYAIDGSLIKMDIKTGDVVKRIVGLSDNSYYYVFDITSDCKYLAAYYSTDDSSSKAFLNIVDAETEEIVGQTEINSCAATMSPARFSKDGKVLVLFNNRDKYVTIRDVKTLNIIDTFRLNGDIINLNISPDSKSVLIYAFKDSTTGETILFTRNIEGSSFNCTMDIPDRCFSTSGFEFVDDSKKAVGKFIDENEVVFHENCGDEWGPHFRHLDPVSKYYISPDNKNLITFSESYLINDINYRYINIWDINSNNIIKKYDFTDNIGLPDIAASPDGNYLALTDDSYLYLLDFSNIAGIQEKCDTAQDVSIYPNPTDSYINISLKDINAVHQKNFIEIFNCLGESVIKTQPIERINVTMLAAGIYFININGKMYKFVKIL